MNKIHFISEYCPFEELSRRPYIVCHGGRIIVQTTSEVMIMNIVLSIYSCILAIAVWQETASGRERRS
jgi:hypothetical protein